MANRPGSIPQQKRPAQTYPPPTSRMFSHRSIYILLSIITFAVYANTMQNGFALDDATVITNNTIVSEGINGIPDILTTSRLTGFKQGSDAESYRPLPLITHAIEYQLFDTNPAPSHFLNILLFIGCVISLFSFLNNFFNAQRQGIAFITALLFALHPIHTEVVANIKSRDELLCFLFAFLSLNTFINYARQGKTLQLISGAVLLFLSFLSKETVIFFVSIIPLVFFFYITENKKRTFFISCAAILATTCFLLIRTAVIGNNAPDNIVFISNPLISVTDMGTRIATALTALGTYLKLLCIPYPLICDYSYNSIPIVEFSNIFALLSLAIYTSLAIIGIYRLIKHPTDPWAFAILFFLISIVLFSNIPFLVYSQMAERFLFFASVGFCLTMALTYEKFIVRKAITNWFFINNTGAAAALAIVCIAFSLLTIMRNAEWRDNYTLFSTDIKKSPANSKMYFFMATAISQDRYAEETNAKKKMEMDGESILLLNRAIAIYPEFSEAYAEIGRIYDRMGRFDSSLVYSTRAISLNSGNMIATYNLARAHYALKNYPEAIKLFKKTLAVQPELTYGLLNLARCYLEYRQYDSAIVYFNRTLSVEPSQSMAKQGLFIARKAKREIDTVGAK